MSKILELAKKLNELAKRGDGGEKVNAQAALDRLIKEHNISIDDIESDFISYHSIFVPGEYIKLFQQIVACVVGPKDAEMRIDLVKKDYYLVKGTMIQAIEIQLRFDFYLDLFKKEFDIFMGAFCAKNHLIPEGMYLNYHELSQEERIKQIRIRQMSEHITQRDYIKGIKE